MKKQRFAPKKALAAHGIASATFSEDGWFLRFNDRCGVLLRVDEDMRESVDWIWEHEREQGFARAKA